ncbi:BnaC06g04550D [Brassica napus]|uniref:BnaC06g04550D protein n=2 Tax=Brassica TaxID=3705 RepID=A0A078IK59_BRANA|nr:BnaC06g04550D [Brassica napus]
MVIGPLLQPTLNTSAAALLSLIKDVANAHIQAELLTTLKLLTSCIIFTLIFYSLRNVQMKKVFIPTYKVSKEKAESLGVEFVPLEIQNERIIIQMISAIIFHR